MEQPVIGKIEFSPYYPQSMAAEAKPMPAKETATPKAEPMRVDTAKAPADLESYIRSIVREEIDRSERRMVAAIRHPNVLAFLERQLHERT